mmetsp:Transcript_34224/g.68459  ORF Transcript_34224/g.68459 Transcript_34224/m.68459 type:complete len:200 (+) Transcript_34224:643-1242(+)
MAGWARDSNRRVAHAPTGIRLQNTECQQLGGRFGALDAFMVDQQWSTAVPRGKTSEQHEQACAAALGQSLAAHFAKACRETQLQRPLNAPGQPEILRLLRDRIFPKVKGTDAGDGQNWHDLTLMLGAVTIGATAHTLGRVKRGTAWTRRRGRTWSTRSSTARLPPYPSSPNFGPPARVLPRQALSHELTPELHCHNLKA